MHKADIRHPHWPRMCDSRSAGWRRDLLASDWKDLLTPFNLEGVSPEHLGLLAVEGVPAPRVGGRAGVEVFR